MKLFKTIKYKNETITKVFGGYTVFFQEDEIFFLSLEEAKQFIDENF